MALLHVSQRQIRRNGFLSHLKNSLKWLIFLDFGALAILGLYLKPYMALKLPFTFLFVE
jgi:hypothetical protein